MSSSQKEVKARIKNRCTVCSSHRLAVVMELPELPLTGIYVKDHGRDHLYPKHDQAFLVCEECGHGQLKYALDPEYLYEDTYTHRGGVSPIASGGNDFLARFVEKVAGGRTFKHILDIGCSDLYLLHKIRHMARGAMGVDPIWRGKEHVTSNNIRIVGKFIEEIDWQAELEEAPDLIVSAHTFEHIDEAGEELRRAVEVAEDGALIVVEVPGFDALLTTLRFDQVFHQHINYYNLSSFLRLIERLNCSYLAHAFNYGFWHGTLMVAFVKGKLGVEVPSPVKPDSQFVRDRFGFFKHQLRTLQETIDVIKEPIYGYGGAQMAPILAYHMNSDWSYLEAILDDNPDRHGMSYPHLPPVIRLPESNEVLSEAAVLITALDSARPILRRVMDLKARRVLLPMHLI